MESFKSIWSSHYLTYQELWGSYYKIHRKVELKMQGWCMTICETRSEHFLSYLKFPTKVKNKIKEKK